MDKKILYAVLAGVIIVTFSVYAFQRNKQTNVVETPSFQKAEEKIVQMPRQSSTTCYYLEVSGQCGAEFVSAIPGQPENSMFLDDTFDCGGYFSETFTDGSKYTEDFVIKDPMSEVDVVHKKGEPKLFETPKARSKNSQGKVIEFFIINNSLFATNDSGKDTLVGSSHGGTSLSEIKKGTFLISFATGTSVSLLHPENQIPFEERTEEKVCSNVKPYNFDIVIFKIGDVLYTFDTMTNTFLKK